MKKMKWMMFLFGIFASFGLAAQTQQEMVETQSGVPELTAFHDVIHPIWHTAYPAKDAKMLRGFVPQVTELSAKIYAAKLPGILREKEAKWKDGVAQLKTAVDAYLKAAAGRDDQALLKSAEVLHANYEALVRAINPVLPEMGAFHQVLYVLVHTYAPNKDFDKIQSLFPDFQTKSELILKAQLPARFETKKEAFEKTARELSEAVIGLAAAANGHDHDGMLAGVEKVHAKYQALEKIFE
jgi:hypothetical protein